MLAKWFLDGSGEYLKLTTILTCITSPSKKHYGFKEKKKHGHFTVPLGALGCIKIVVIHFIHMKSWLGPSFTPKTTRKTVFLLHSCFKWSFACTVFTKCTKRYKLVKNMRCFRNRCKYYQMAIHTHHRIQSESLKLENLVLDESECGCIFVGWIPTTCIYTHPWYCWWKKSG